MKKLVRTVPAPLGDDSVVHEDIMNLDTQIFKNVDIRIKVCKGCFKKKSLEGKEFCKKCKGKINS